MEFATLSLSLYVDVAFVFFLSVDLSAKSIAEVSDAESSSMLLSLAVTRLLTNLESRFFFRVHINRDNFIKILILFKNFAPVYRSFDTPI